MYYSLPLSIFFSLSLHVSSYHHPPPTHILHVVFFTAYGKRIPRNLIHQFMRTLFILVASTQFSEPVLGTNADESFSVQPFAGYPEHLHGGTNATPTAHLSTTPPTNIMMTSHPSPAPPTSSLSSQDKPPPPPSAAGSGSGGSANPYRIGTGIGSRKPAYGTSGIASFSGTSSVAPPTSQMLTQQPPPMMVPSQPMTAPSQPQAPPTSISSGPGPSLYPSGPPMGTAAPLGVAPPTGIPIHTGAPTHVVEPHLSETGWDHTSQPVRYHWFYLRSGEKYWIPFSLVDTHRLEQAYNQHPNTSDEVSESLEGGRKR